MSIEIVLHVESKKSSGLVFLLMALTNDLIFLSPQFPTL